MAQQRSIQLLVVTLLFAGSALAGPTYPVTARLTLAPQEEQHCLRTIGGGTVDCSIIEAARAAFTAAVSRMFTPGPNPNLVLVLRVADTEIFEQVSGGYSLDVAVTVRVESPDGARLDEIRSGGRATVGPGSSLPEASAEAAKQAAAAFELDYARSEAISSYLVRNEIAAPAAVSMAPRSRQLVWLGAGAGFMQGAGDGDVAPMLSARAGVSFRWLMLQALYSRYTGSFTAALFTPDLLENPTGDLHLNDLGFEAGYVLRLGPSVELHAGPGVHFLFGDAGIGQTDFKASQSVSFTKISPTVFASISASFLPFRNGIRFIAGAEARGFFWSSIDLPDFSRRIPTANFSAMAFVGVEFPWSAAKGDAK